MSPKTLKRLEDSRDACVRIRKFLKSVPMDTFLGSDLLQSAVERQLEIIGEALGAAAKEDDSLVQMIPDLPRIVGLRNRLIHGYDSVDSELVWDVTQSKIPVLRKQLEAVLRDSGGEKF